MKRGLLLLFCVGMIFLLLCGCDSPQTDSSSDAGTGASVEPTQGEELPPVIPTAWNYTVYELYGYDCIRGAHNVEYAHEYNEITYQYPKDTPKTVSIFGRELEMFYECTLISPHGYETKEMYRSENASDPTESWRETVSIGAETGRLLSYVKKNRIYKEDAPASLKTQSECLADAERRLRAELPDFEAYQLLEETADGEGAHLKYSFLFAKMKNGRCADAVTLTVSAADASMSYNVMDPKLADLKLLLNDEMLRDVKALIDGKIHEIYSSDTRNDFTYEISEEMSVTRSIAAGELYALHICVKVSVTVPKFEPPYLTDQNEFYVILEPVE